MRMLVTHTVAPRGAAANERAVERTRQCERTACRQTRVSPFFGGPDAVSVVSGRFSGSEDVSGILRGGRKSARGRGGSVWAPKKRRNPSQMPSDESEPLPPTDSATGETREHGNAKFRRGPSISI